jgi:cytochrome c oxidase subunit 1
MTAAFLSTDHKVVAIRAGVAAALFFAGAGVLALLIRTELAQPGLQVVSRAGYTQLFTMHGSTMIFLVVIPIALAVCLYLVPLQIGALQVSGARWAFAGQWLVALGGIVMWTGWLTREGTGRAGWYAYDPLARTPATPGPGMDLWLCGAIMATLGAIFIGAAVLTTIVRRRAPGMTMLRLPVFTWTALASCLLVVFAFPSLVVAFGLLLVERHGARILDPIAYQHLFWFYGHPAVYVMFFPFVGAVAESLAIFSGRRFFGYKFFVPSVLLFAALSTSVWGHHMFTTGQVSNRFFALTSTAIVIPAGIEYFDLLGTLWKGTIRLTTPLLFAVGFLVQFLVGGLTGVMVASPALDYHLNNSYFVVAHFHYTLFAGSAFGLFAGLYLWWPKFTGYLLREGLGKLHFWLLVLGTNLTFLPMFFLGEQGMTRRIADYPADTGWETLNVLETIGAFVIALAVAVFLVNVAISARRRVPAGADPWDGQTLEWATSSPPPPHNFDVALPPVKSYAPLFDLKEGKA